MHVGHGILVLLGVCALAAVGMWFRLGEFKGLLEALRADHNREQERTRAKADHVVNHLMTLGEKVDKSTATTGEMNRHLRGARDDLAKGRGGSRP